MYSKTMKWILKHPDVKVVLDPKEDGSVVITMFYGVEETRGKHETIRIDRHNENWYELTDHWMRVCLVEMYKEVMDELTRKSED